MELGFLTVCLGNMPLKEKAKWAGENGFKELEVACWPKSNTRDYSSCDLDVENFTEQDAKIINEYLKEYGLTISSLAYYDNNLHKDLAKRTLINNHVKKCIDAANMLGVQAVGTFTGRNIDKSIKDNFDEFEVVFKDLISYAENKGVRLMIENCPMEGWQAAGQPGNISFTPELWEEMFRRIPSKNFGLNFDPSHLLFQLIDYIPLIEKFKDRIFHVHAKDSEVYQDKLKYYGVFNCQLGGHNEGYWRFRMPGLGQVDWEKFLKALDDIGYNGVVSIEHEDPLYEGSEEKVKEGLIIARKHLEQYMK
ncbi:MAG: sugar phosphate isomerase/epimerase [Clostridiaceae bacterium]|jgi:sugar phosphate isomerase/epimerase|nr:sugar phosphate isomerase/epimerase [Clostridiaceae bacterium]